MKMAMSVGNNRHYRFGQIHGRHFVQTALPATFPAALGDAVQKRGAGQARRSQVSMLTPGTSRSCWHG